MLSKKPIVLRRFAGIILSACLLCSGCGPAQGTLKGKVTLDGVALKAGKIDFVSKSGGRGATATIAEDGTYTIPMMFAGDFIITVDTEYLKPKNSNVNSMYPNSKGGMPSGMPKGASGPPTGKGVPKDFDKQFAGHEMPEGYAPTNPADVAKKYVRLPAKYSDAAQSGLTYTFPGGDQTHDLVLVGGGK